ncbi:MAG: enoyl-CoA hydratase/isomerase family protein [Planctomycetota bacterium]|nr:enoyl-CoA hydratase/isomerase family protein [Planctomycetota bacterium]
MNNTQSDLVTLSAQSPVGTLTLNRPDARNALSLELLDALHARLDELAARTDLHVLVVTGAGKAFCAGMDLKLVLDVPGAPLKLLTSLAEATLKLRALPMVTLAKVNGAAIGGGCGLACVCDLTLTHADAKLGFPEVDLGVCPAVVAPWLVRKVGAGHARRILLSGGLMSGERAFSLAMVDHLVPGLADLDAAADTIAQRLASGGPNALRATKDLLNHLDDSINPDLPLKGAQLSAKVIASDEAQAMLRAKMTK